MLKKFYAHLSQAHDILDNYHKNIKLATNIKIKNTQLYNELEKACEKKNGVLTYAEYLTIDQFGENGFYSTSKTHGKTDVEKRWGNALSNYCQDLGYNTILEFGCGNGDLGVSISKAYKKKTKKNIKWIGVEIDSRMHERIYNNFCSHNLQDSVEKIAISINELRAYQNDTLLIVFPYSLDNIPPQILLNINYSTSQPNALLGIKAKNGTISECIITPDVLQKKGIRIKNGIYSQDNYQCNISSWKIRKGQRAYIPVDALLTLYSYVKIFNSNSKYIIIDEFRKEPWFFNLDNIGIPKSLYEKNLVCNDRFRYYRESGKHNLYYPLYINTLLQFLNSIGFQSIDYDVEQKKAARLNNKPWISFRENYATLAFTAQNLNTNKKNNILPITFNPQRII